MQSAATSTCKSIMLDKQMDQWQQVCRYLWDGHALKIPERFRITCARLRAIMYCGSNRSRDSSPALPWFFSSKVFTTFFASSVYFSRFPTVRVLWLDLLMILIYVKSQRASKIIKPRIFSFSKRACFVTRLQDSRAWIKLPSESRRMQPEDWRF